MKRYGNLYEKVISLDNLRLADENARKRKKHRKEINRFDENKEGNLRILHESLKNKTFQTSRYRTFMVYDPKKREISALPYYPDRIVHHAIMNVLEPIWSKTLPYNSYSCIKKRGVHGCARRVRYIFRKYDGRKLYCLKTDIKSFYPSIRHEVMKEVIRRKIKDADLLWLLDGIIDSGEGLPIGNYVSQTMANLLLSSLMHRLSNDGYDCVEYSDDIVVFSDNKDVLHKVLEEYMRPEIEGHLKLKIKGNYQIFPIATDRYSNDGRGLDYLGYVFFRQHTMLRKRIKKNFIKKYWEGVRNGLSGKKLLYIMASYLSWSKHCDARNLEKKILKFL